MSGVEVRDLCVTVTQSGRNIVDGVSFSIAPGEVLGLVGESGSGKSTTGLALLGHARPGAVITEGTVHVGDTDVLALSGRQLRELRGGLVSYVPQDPAAALNPAIRIGKQLREMIDAHSGQKLADGATAEQRIATVMEEVRLPSDKQFLARYPHQLSGGQQQRVCIAMAFLLQPSVIVMDEPTTGLDVTTQAYVLRMVGRLCRTHSVATLYVTHDLAVVANLADRVMVMYDGKVVEENQTSHIFTGASHDYTRRLIAAVPDKDRPAPIDTAGAILTASNLKAWHGKRLIVDDVALDIQPNECVAIVGESGSGKTTLARTLIGLHAKWTGEILFGGKPLTERARNRPAEVRQMLQYIFQSPYNSLNPRRTVAASIGLPLDLFFDVSRAERRQRIADALTHVGLVASMGEKLPAQLSGGERQRVSIARALVCEPSVLVCDEITSALDVSVQASIVRLLARLQQEDGLAMLFITHNLPLARTIAHRVLVMSEGKVVESGPTADVYDNPQHPYTKQLIENSPTIPTAA